MRRTAALIHRWAGLAMAGFLLVAGLTGAVLAWYHELDALVNPGLTQARAPVPGAVPLDPLVLRERVQAAYPEAWVRWVDLRREPGQAARPPFNESSSQIIFGIDVATAPAATSPCGLAVGAGSGALSRAWRLRRAMARTPFRVHSGPSPGTSPFRICSMVKGQTGGKISSARPVSRAASGMVSP
jgi:hypothetical protein